LATKVGLFFRDEVEGRAVRLVVDQLGPADVEELERAAQHGSEMPVRAEMVAGAGEADQGAVVARSAVDALAVGARQIAQDLHLGLDHAERLRVGSANRPAGALAGRRLTDEPLPERDDLRQQLVEVRIDGLDLRAVANELG
jgi:hypothetical protein